ncbi:MAG: hypothetical protein HY670_03855 [Chloroflexi bacterium]|nr:hypothetical protein [Chloroflexota bacterium]
MKYGREVAVLGIGMHPWGMFPDKDFTELGAHAIREALQDAGLEWQDIQFMGSGIDQWRGTSGLWAGNEIALRFGEIGIPIINVSNACATGVYSLKVVCDQIRLGDYDIGLAIGAGKSPGGMFPLISPATPVPADVQVVSWKIGLPNPSFWAMYMMRRMLDYGDTEEMLAKIKVKSSKGGTANPYARYRKEYTIQEVLASPMVCYPLRLFEICATSQGAAAVILGSLDVARRLGKKPITVAAATAGSPLYGDSTLRLRTISSSARETGPYFSEAITASRRAFEEAGIGPEDIDIAEIPDNSGWHELQYFELDGFCKPGEAGHLVNEGYTDIGGKLPVNMSGGMASYGEVTNAQGLQQVCDMVRQLRDQASRQVPGVKTGFCQTYGGGGNNSVAILKS